MQVTPRMRYGVCGGDETLKRRVAAKFAEGDVSGAVRDLTSAEGLAPRDGDTLRALKEKHPLAPENLSFPDPPDGSVVPAVTSEENVWKKILSFHAGASWVLCWVAETGKFPLSSGLAPFYSTPPKMRRCHLLFAGPSRYGGKRPGGGPEGAFNYPK